MTGEQTGKSGQPVYREMDRPTLDAAYNNTEAVADSPDHLARWNKDSAFYRGAHEGYLDIEYGIGERNRIDIFPCADKAAPIFCFIHGGYWQRNAKEMFNFLAKGPNRAGMHFANIGYTLAPTAGLAAIAGEIDTAIDHIAGMTGDKGLNPSKMIIGGWSAGAHLAVVTSANRHVSGVLAISGIYELEPIALSYINDNLHLTTEEIETLSPSRHLPDTNASIALVYGAEELPELRRQSEEFATIAKDKGIKISVTGLKGHNHYTILDELADPKGSLTKALLNLAGQ